ncbi:trypsin-1 [Aplysia californica]|uniref:Trypsin-1 n=1 Tax=Aplysia californica TaxID=6500 RepID=A0ABM1A8H2_APLCA|nr:trypsin-1 [Aplysia californica]
MGTPFQILVALAVALCTASLATAQDGNIFVFGAHGLGSDPAAHPVGGGIQSRSRTCSTGNNKDCTNQTSLAVESQKCNTQDCPKTNAPSNITPSNGQCGQANNFRIVGGTKSASCEYPWMVVVYDQKNGFLCGGSIIDESTILTAGHCVSNPNSQRKEVPSAPSDMVIYSGSSKVTFDSPPPPGLHTNSASKITVHEKYNINGDLENDIAIIKLSKPLTFDRCQRPVCLVDGSKTPQEASGCKTMGWGVTSNGRDAKSPDDMFWTTVNIATDLTCRDEYGGDSTTFCAGGNNKDSCKGDSGGPLVCKEADGRYYQYGIVSAGPENQCGIVPGLYTRVSAFLSWISSHRN